jgi:isopentenyl phosphate kinase
LIPVVNGDVAFDIAINGTILSTEDIFIYLLDHIDIDRILLAGTEPGIWRDFATKHDLIPTMTPDDLPSLSESLGGSNATDVTGGMAEKVRLMASLVEKYPHLKVSIFSGEKTGNLYTALMGGYPGTTIQQKD